MFVTIDTETTGLDVRHKRDNPFIISTCTEKNKLKIWEWDVDPFTRKVKIPDRDIKDFLEYIHSFDEWIFHNALFDIAALSNINAWPIRRNRHRSYWSHIHDTQVASHLANSLGRHGLKELAAQLCCIPTNDQADLQQATIAARRVGKQNGWSLGPNVGADYWMPRAVDPSDKLASTYAGLDAQRTALVWLAVRKRLESLNLFEKYLQQRDVLVPRHRMTSRGVALSVPAMDKTERILTKQANEGYRTLVKLAANFGMENFNPNSPPQLSLLLFKHCKLPVLKRTEPSNNAPQGNPSTDGPTINALLNHPKKLNPVGRRALEALLLYKRPTTGLSYLKSYRALSVKMIARKTPNSPPRNIPEYRVIHGTYNPTGTVTVRDSSSDPNLQNISKGDEDEGKPTLRHLFVPRPGFMFLDFDYDQLELRLYAYRSGDKTLQTWFAEGRNVHLETGRIFFGEHEDEKFVRKRGKTFNFQNLYGGGKEKAAQATGIPNAKELWAERLPRAAEFMQETIRFARKNGYIETLWGYRLAVDPELAYKSVDYLMQGSAGDLIRQAMLLIDDFIIENPDLGLHMLLQVHDQLVFELPIEKYSLTLVRQIAELMQQPGKKLKLHVPVSATVRYDNWAKGEEVNLDLPTKLRSSKFQQPVTNRSFWKD